MAKSLSFDKDSCKNKSESISVADPYILYTDPDPDPDPAL